MSVLKKKEYRNFYLRYICLFFFFMIIILYFYYSKGKATVNNNNDGFKQYYRALLYISNYYKKILSNIFINRSFVVPQWDFVLGEGGDIIETFHYYGLGDPINLLSIFFNEKNLYIFHDISIFIRMFLAGFVFSKFCFYKNYNNSIVVLTGSLLYAFSSYAFRVLTNYIYFINPLIYFPLIILGVEKIICENKGTILTIGVALASMTSIYFFYMIVLATIVYVVIRLLSLKISFNMIIKKVSKIFIFSLFGLLISAIVFFPSMHSLINNGRVGAKVQINMFYDLGHYISLFTDFIFNSYSGWYYGGYTLLGFFGIITIIVNKGNKTLKWLLLSSLIIMSFPLFGSIFNGMTYIVDRYEFFLTFLIIFCVVASYEKLVNNKKHILTCFVLLLVYTITSILDDYSEIKTYILFFCLGTFLLLILLFVNNENIKKYMYLFIAIVSILFTITYKYLPNYWNHAEKNGSDILKLTTIHNEEPSIFNDINDNTFYRYSGNSLPDNVSINGNKSSTGYYWSVANNNIADFRSYNGFCDETSFYFSNYDGDYIFNSLSGVKYYFVKKGERVPYNYKLFNKYDDYDLYINNDALPLIYGYDYSISIDEYIKAPILKRKELITQAVVTNYPNGDNFVYKSNIKEIKTNISYEDSIVFDDSRISTTLSNSVINIKYDSANSGEYYLVIEDIYPDVETNIIVSNSKGINKTISIKTKNSHAYDGRNSFVVNLGYYDNIEDNVTLNILPITNMTYKKIGIYCMPLESITKKLEDLNCVEIKKLDISDNNINADISVVDDKYLCFSIPNYDGWSAYVDGEKTTLDEYNIMYMGFPINKGNHHIELKYSTPLFKEGLVITALSLSAFVIMSIKRKNKKNI